jgi:ABC-type glycerol-3-phosphate transport system substrate-binding protein
MKVYKDNFITVLVTIIIILVMGLAGFFIGSFILAPKTSTKSDKTTYKPKVKYPNGPITLTYWRTIEGVDVFAPILEEYKKLYANVKIEIKDIPFAEYDARLADAAKNNNLPDLFMLRSDWVPRYRDYMKQSPNEVFSTEDYKKIFAPVTSEDLIYNNEVYAVSYGIPTLGLFYNSDKFSSQGITDPPATWQELLDINSKLVTREGNGLVNSGIALGTANISAASGIMPLLMIQNGATMTDSPPTKATFEKPGVDNYPSSSKALDFYTSFAKPNKSSYSWSDGFGNDIKAFENSKTAMIIDYPFRYTQIKNEARNLNFKTAKAPQVNPNSPVNYTVYWAEGVSKNSKYPEVAWDFYNFMTSYEIMNIYTANTLRPASRLDLAKAQEQDTILGPFAAQVPTAKSYYKGNNAQSDAAMLQMISTALSGFDPAIAVRAASDSVTKSIQQYPYK